MNGPKIFYRRNLPHWHPPGVAMFLTWRLHGSLPRSAIERIEATRTLLKLEAERAGESLERRTLRHSKKLFVMFDSFLDTTHGGPQWLKQPVIAGLVENALLSRYSELYQLGAYVVMPNHVHLLIRPKSKPASPVESLDSAYVPVEHITKALKGTTAREANQILGRTGERFWQDETYDHWPRDTREFYRIVSYIEMNPVKAGLAAQPEDWQWSSAHERKRRGYTVIKSLTDET